ncbi:DUF4105 domain-containing protein [Prevotella denticola]|uniref:Lnb N-terminal periplasmic domain-containing protein n=1 Tax=Prevotella denticola TaxID=28129 RepID=UPI001BA96049|nr:DUF4105 domain-containing protein [Prevotella denticola]QUB93793.1 DUF4105 domain-containing protein [Prevotella denticola]
MRKGLLYIVLSFLLSVSAAAGTGQAVCADSVQISLLTCSPGEEVWAQYGHTAIRYRDRKSGEDLVVNYGIFSQDQPYFIPRFIFGLTDYRMGVEPMDRFLAQYRYERRGIVEQVLDLSAEDKQAIRSALQENMKPENIVYRYNFFFDNCTTRARDMLVDHLHGKVVYPAADSVATFRSMIHEWNHDYEWSQFGEDLLLGVNADRKTTKSEQQFLPDNLRRDFARATYNGKPLIKETHTLLAPQAEMDEADCPFSPLSAALVFVIVCVVMMTLSNLRRRLYRGWDAVLMTASGAMGIVFFLMLFSQHPCVSLNAILFFFNPLPLFFLYATVWKRKEVWWKIWCVLIVLGFIGSLFQEVPVPVLIVALFLLLHCILHLRISRLLPPPAQRDRK